MAHVLLVDDESSIRLTLTALLKRANHTLMQAATGRDALENIEKMFQVAEADSQTIDDYRVYNILGNAHFALHNYRDAAAAYQTALKIAPANSDSLEKIRQYHQFAIDLSIST